MNRVTTTRSERQRWALCHWQLWPMLVLLMTLCQPALAQTYTAIDCPFSSATLARGINDRGDIVGFCDDVDGTHGFRLRNGALKLLDVPNAESTQAFGVNIKGQIVGHYFSEEDQTFHGFLFEPASASPHEASDKAPPPTPSTMA